MRSRSYTTENDRTPLLLWSIVWMHISKETVRLNADLRFTSTSCSGFTSWTMDAGILGPFVLSFPAGFWEQQKRNAFHRKSWNVCGKMKRGTQHRRMRLGTYLHWFNAFSMVTLLPRIFIVTSNWNCTAAGNYVRTKLNISIETNVSRDPQPLKERLTTS